MLSNPLFDLEFLNNLFLKNEREIYARITALNLNEEPIEYIEGKISDGTINVDGNSSVRRTCNLTMTAQDININEFYWGIKNKFKLEIGLKNDINNLYPEIIWFKQGIYVITEFNTSLATNKWTIKIQGKDKMCLLNGDLSGNFMINTELGIYEDAQTKEHSYRTIKEILYDVICVQGKELISNVVINDLADSGRFVQEYNNIEDAFLYRDVESNEFKNLLMDSQIECYYQINSIYSKQQYQKIPKKYEFLKEYFIYNENKAHYEFDLEAALNGHRECFEMYVAPGNSRETYWFRGCLEDDFNITYDEMVTGLEGEKTPTIIKFGLSISDNEYIHNNYYLAKISTGDLVGYELTDLTYAASLGMSSGSSSTSVLLASVGEPITSVLDKIKNVLGNFEYYYDIDGRFVFQKIQDSVDTPWNSVIRDEKIEYSNSLVDSNKYAFSFVDSKLVTSFANNPKLTDLKNDYVVWGKYNLSGMEIPIHMRYAIDIKPTKYRPIRPLKEEVITILQAPNGEVLNNTTTYKYYDAPEKEPYNDLNLKKIMDPEEFEWGQTMQQFSIFTPEGNKLTTIIYPYFAKEAYTSETLDWRELIYQMALDSSRLRTNDNFLYYIAQANPTEFPTGYTGYEQYYTDLELHWRDLYNLNPKQNYSSINIEDIDINNLYIKDYYRELTYEDFDKLTYESLYVFSSPTNYNKEQSPYVKIYPFANSDVGCLQTKSQYFLTKDGEWTPIIAEEVVSPSSQDLYANYETLNNTSFKNIFMKNMKEFKVKTGNGGYYSYGVPKVQGSLDAHQCFYVPFYETQSTLDTYAGEENQDYLIVIEKLFENTLNYLKDLNSLMGILSVLYPYGLITSETYNLLCTTIRQSNLKDRDKEALLNNIENYFIERDADFCTTFINQLSTEDGLNTFLNSVEENLKNEIISAIDKNLLIPNFIIEEDKYYYQFTQSNNIALVVKDNIHTLYSKYCVKENNKYIKFDDLSEKIKAQYFSSNLDAYYFTVRDYLYAIEKLSISSEPKEKINYILSYVTALKTFLKNIDAIADDEIKTILLSELNRITESYGRLILDYFNNWVDQSLASSIAAPPIHQSCLIQLQEDLRDVIETNLESYLEKYETVDYFYIIETLNNINNAYQMVVNEIYKGYDENNGVLGILAEITKLRDEEKLTKDKLISLFKEQSDYLKDLTNGSIQSQCTVEAITVQYLPRLQDALPEDERVVMEQVINDYENHLYRYILSLKQYMGITEENEESYENTMNFNLKQTLLNLRKFFEDFEILSNKIQQLKSLKTLNVESLEQAENIITFSRAHTLQKVIILPNLHNKIYSCENIQDIQKSINSYVQSTNVFQLNLTREDNNHFNNYSSYRGDDGYIVESMKIISEPISYCSGYYNYNLDDFWTHDLQDRPQLLTFWFDFLDPDNSELAKYSVPTAGTRTKAIREDTIRAIHYKDIPNVIFTNGSSDYDRQHGYLYVTINEAARSLFKNYAVSKTAKTRIDELLYQHSYCTQTISVQSIPIYHLQPNNRIYIRDDRSGINGEYIINKLSIPLNFKKLMTINATKIMPNIS